MISAFGIDHGGEISKADKKTATVAAAGVGSTGVGAGFLVSADRKFKRSMKHYDRAQHHSQRYAAHRDMGRAHEEHVINSNTDLYQRAGAKAHEATHAAFKDLRNDPQLAHHLKRELHHGDRELEHLGRGDELQRIGQEHALHGVTGVAVGAGLLAGAAVRARRNHNKAKTRAVLQHQAKTKRSAP